MTGQTASARSGAPARLPLQKILRALRMPLAILAALLVFAAFSPQVLTVGNLRNIALQASFLMIFSLAQCVVILTRGFDLSLGFTVSLVSVVSALAMAATGAVLPGLAAGLGVGLAVGLANGLLVGAVGLNPLVTTLGMGNILLALASTVSGGFPVSGLPAGFNAAFAQGTFLGLPAPIWSAALLLSLLGLVLHLTPLGRSWYILGANPRAGRAAGIRAVPVLVAAYAICSLLAAAGALLMTARTGSGEPNLGGNLTLESIAAAVVGGAKLSGGEGGISAAILGAVFITILSNGMNLVQVDGYLQQICLGLIILASLVLSRGARRR
ncbi:ABC transporter permease [Poseidonocella sp. HB161398]|uniref:ABC transporter permease n=1 Tax=Poseidonocella sp. HB161398 TaxID=2320855 RepID=UPI0011085072|nr:ABC transporter permease [Poseidonocella sp. HB161398]